MHTTDRSCQYYIQDVFFWRLAGPIAPTGKAIVHWIGCINAIKSKIQNGRHMWGGENFFKIAKSTFLDTPWVEIFDEIALSRTVKEIEANLCFAIFGKNSKI